MSTTFFSRRLAAQVLLASLAATPLMASAQDKPLEWVVGYAAGGGSDMVGPHRG